MHAGACKHKHEFKSINTHTHTRLHARTHACTHTHTHIHTRTHAHTHTHARTHVHTLTHTHTRTHTHTHSRIHSHSLTHSLTHSHTHSLTVAVLTGGQKQKRWSIRSLPPSHAAFWTRESRLVALLALSASCWASLCLMWSGQYTDQCLSYLFGFSSLLCKYVSRFAS